MAILQRGMWLCGYCGKAYTDQVKADNCRDSHELIYIPLTKTDLNRLLQFLYTKNEELLTESLVNTLQTYLGGN
jgi:hypothetical protein